MLKTSFLYPDIDTKIISYCTKLSLIARNFLLLHDTKSYCEKLLF